MLTPTLKDHTGRTSINRFWHGSNAWSHVRKLGAKRARLLTRGTAPIPAGLNLG